MNVAAGFLAVAFGGAFGACARYSISLLLAGSSTRFPFGTLAANLGGALLAGFIVTLLLSRGQDTSTAQLQLLIVTGFLGSFTTLSAFSIETIRLVQSGAVLAALIYVLASIAGALVLALMGGWIARLFVV